MDKSIKSLLKRNPDRLPVICNPGNNSSLKPLDKKKFLVPKDLTFFQFLYVLRSRLDNTDLQYKDAIYLYIIDKNGKMFIPNNQIFASIYDEYKREDDCIYVYYDKEATFG